MSIAVFPLDMPPLVRPADDRALGETGRLMRSQVLQAMARPDDRGMEISTRLLTALTGAREEDGTLINPETFRRALELLNILPPDLPLPEVVVENGDEIGLDWDEGSRRSLTLTVRNTSLVGFSAVFGVEPMYGRVTFAGEVPETLSFLLARLYPRSRKSPSTASRRA
jgi:hypothetical protein